MFQKNINALKDKNPKLAEKLVNFPLKQAEEKIEVFQAESEDIIISYNNIPLNSVYDPKREAKSIWNKTIQGELRKNDFQFVFGLGLGYLFKRAYVNADTRVIVYEPFIEVLRYVFEYIDLSKEISDLRVFISDGLQECMDFLYKKYLSEDKIEVLFNEPYVQLANKELIDLTNNLIHVCQERNMDVTTIKVQSKIWVKNTLLNLFKSENCRPLNYLENKFNSKNVIITAAGPSLKNDIPIIKENREKFIIICANKAFRTLYENDITPDFLVFMDYSLLMKSLYKESDTEEEIEKINKTLAQINFISGLKADYQVLNVPSKSNFLYFQGTDEIAKLISNLTDNKIKTYESASSTALIAYYIAKEMGFSQVIYSGLDLAFTYNKLYSDNSDFTVDESGKLTDSINKNVIYVKGKHNNDIATRSDYALFIRQFEETLNKEEALINVINTSSGALISGMVDKRLQDIIVDLDKSNVSVEKIISEVYSETESEWQNLLLIIKEHFLSLIKKTKELSMQLNEFTPKVAQVNILDENSIITNKEFLEDLLTQSSQIVSKILNNVFFLSFLQGELLAYSTKNTKKGSLTIKEFKENVQKDITFIKSAKDSSENFMEFLKTNIIKV